MLEFSERHPVATKIIKVARTIADLECCDEIMDYHIIESIGFRKNVFGEII